MAGAPVGGWEARGDKHRRWTQLDSHFQGPHILTTTGHVPIVTGADPIEQEGRGNKPTNKRDKNINRTVLLSRHIERYWAVLDVFLSVLR